MLAIGRVKLSKFTLFLVLLVIVLSILFVAARREVKRLHRNPIALMNRYYTLRQKDLNAAQKALLILLKEDKNYEPALKELSQLYIQEKKPQEALPLVQRLHELVPQNKSYTMQLATLYYETGSWDHTHNLLNELENTQNWNTKAQKLLSQMTSFLPNFQSGAQVSSHYKDVKTQSSTVSTLLNRFYTLKKEEPQKAEQMLPLLNTLNPDNEVILLERGYFALQHKEQKKALSYFLQAYTLKPTPGTALQLAYLYNQQKEEKEAAGFFLIAMSSSNQELKTIASKGYADIRAPKPRSLLASATPKPVSLQNTLMNRYYALKKHNQQAAYQLIQHIISLYPNNFLALKEGGYLAIALKQRNEAIRYFTKAYNLERDADVAMQLGYLFDLPHGTKTISTDKYWAFHYFNLATHTADKKLKLGAQNAMTNLSGLQTKIMPQPFFSEFFFNPFSQSRFGLTINPMVGRLGVEHDTRWQSKTYLVFRRTQDNKSSQAGQVPQIYEDNVEILGLGEQITPIKSFPLIAFLEVGRAYDLVYKNRNRWRNDLRGGLMYYNEFGVPPAYFEHLTAHFNYYSTLYGDATYFSRYNDNIIANVKTHQGLRFLQYHSSMINLYFTGRVIEDTNRDFFNNIAEIGPGIGFIPSNRYKVELRFEHVNGMYLPVRNTTNPYGKYYINNTVQLFFYIKL